MLLAFSGGLDTSTLIPWLKETYGVDVIAYCSDLGNAPDGKWLAEWSKKLGAIEFIFEDLKEHFASEFGFRSVRAGATYQDDYLLGTALGRPLIAERMAHFAKEFGVQTMVHGATGKGNDQLRFERTWAYLAPEIKVLAPWRIWDFKGRKDLLAYLSARGFELDSKEKLYSVDVNLFHRSVEGGILEDPSKDYSPEAVYEWVAPPSKASLTPTEVTIGFERGLPVSLNGKNMKAYPLLAALNEVAGKAGIGVQDLVEERAIGIKSRGIYETPGGTLLHQACRALKHLCWDRSLLNTARGLGLTYGEMIYDGFWHSDTRYALEAFFEKASAPLTGEVSLKLENGSSRITSRKSPYSLYYGKTVSFEEDAEGMHHAAEGYAKLSRLRQNLLGQRAAQLKDHGHT